jgi:uncharacterized protein (TIGR03435 family)
MTKTADASSPTNVLMYPQGVIIAKSATIADLAQWLRSILGQPVMDKTGLEGRWDFTMKWTPDETQFADCRSRRVAQRMTRTRRPRCSPQSRSNWD